MNRRIITVIIIILIGIFPALTAALPSSTDFGFSIIPYLGGMDVNLGSLQYGPHGVSVKWDDKVADYRPNKDGISSYYKNEHIIAIGGVGNIEINRVTTIEDLGLYNVYIPKNGVSLRVQATCDTNFEFVSQSNPIYRRPFEIEIIPRARTTNRNNNGNNNYDTNEPYVKEVEQLKPGNYECTIDLGTSNNNINIGNINGDDLITMLAADIILVLPFDYAKDDGGYFVGGLEYGNAVYALADLNDYTAVVTLSLTLQIEYYKDVDSNGTPIGALYTHEENKVLSIPFAGYYSSNAGTGISTTTDDSINLYVDPTSEAANLNLKEQGTWITVGNIQFIYNDANFISNSNVGKEPGSVLTNSDVVRLFLSASPHPDIESANTFRMVHENASTMITSTNSLSFDARIRGTGASYGDISLKTNSNEVKFDGRASVSTLATLDQNGEITGDLDSVITTCHLEAPPNVIAGYGYRHFHTFEGTVDIMFHESSMLEAGIYRGYVYVHAVTEE